MKTKTQNIKNLWRDAGPFVQAYVECALWSSIGDNDEPLEKNYNWTHLAPETLSKIIEDCKQFQEKANLDNYPIGHAGHDFWLTRNRHGAGFWENDFGTEEQCKELTKLAHSFGECWLHVHRGKLYI